MFSDIQCDPEELVHLIHSTVPGALCSIKTVKRDVIVHKKGRINATCRADTGPVDRNIPVIFEPDDINTLPDRLEAHEALLTLKKGKTSMVQIELINNTNCDIKVCERTLLGSLH